LFLSLPASAFGLARVVPLGPLPWSVPFALPPAGLFNLPPAGWSPAGWSPACLSSAAFSVAWAPAGFSVNMLSERATFNGVSSGAVFCCPPAALQPASSILDGRLHALRLHRDPNFPPGLLGDGAHFFNGRSHAGSGCELR